MADKNTGAGAASATNNCAINAELIPNKYGENIPQNWDVIVVGGGPAGLAAALQARKTGAENVLLLERNDDLGGILNQCIHNGFGLHHFKTELTGPEYAERFIDMLPGSGVTVLCGAMVLEVMGGPQNNGAQNATVAPQVPACLANPPRRCAPSFSTLEGLHDASGKFVRSATLHEPNLAFGPCVHLIHPAHGYMVLQTSAVVLAMGCRERTRGAIGIPGSRPAGVFTAGAAQLYMNIEGYQIGKRAVILGSGDIGLIMARRLTLEGAEVLGVYELMPYSGGLTRNIVQCLDDYGIPLHLSHTITQIKGDKRVEQVVVAKVDENRRPIPGTGQTIDCDTVLLSVGLIPENELSRAAGIQIDPRTSGPVVFESMETSLPGVFACGNVAHVHDLVDFVTAESQRAGANAGRFCKAAPLPAGTPCIEVQAGEGVGYTVPQKIRPAGVENSVDIFFRTRQVYKNVRIVMESGGEELAAFGREHMAPGEMEKIPLPKKIMEKIQNNMLEIRIEAVEGGAQ